MTELEEELSYRAAGEEQLARGYHRVYEAVDRLMMLIADERAVVEGQPLRSLDRIAAAVRQIQSDMADLDVVAEFVIRLAGDDEEDGDEEYS